MFIHIFISDQERVCDYSIKLMDIDSEHLGIPVGHKDSLNVHKDSLNVPFTDKFKVNSLSPQSGGQNLFSPNIVNRKVMRISKMITEGKNNPLIFCQILLANC